MKISAIFGEMSVCHFGIQTKEFLLAKRFWRVAFFGDLCACGVFARVAFSCIGRGPIPVIRELHVRCACVCMFVVQSVESCACAVFFRAVD